MFGCEEQQEHGPSGCKTCDRNKVARLTVMFWKEERFCSLKAAHCCTGGLSNIYQPNYSRLLIPSVLFVSGNNALH